MPEESLEEMAARLEAKAKALTAKKPKKSHATAYSPDRVKLGAGGRLGENAHARYIRSEKILNELQDDSWLKRIAASQVEDSDD